MRLTRECQREHPCPSTGQTSGPAPATGKITSSRLVPERAPGRAPALPFRLWATVMARRRAERGRTYPCEGGAVRGVCE